MINPFKQTRDCCTCKIEKLLFEFHKRKSNKIGYSYRCKYCAKLVTKCSYLNNKKHYIEYRKEWVKNNKDKIAKISKKYRSKIGLESKRYYKKINKEKIAILARARAKKRYKTDINYKLSRRMRGQILTMVKKGGTRKAYKTSVLLGCDINFYKTYLESKFQSGMSWENHGTGVGKWQIDHILPCSKFNLTNPEEQKIAFHYTNTQPMWASENIIKGNKEIYCLIN